MKEEILINVTPREVRAAVLRDGVLQELLVERASRTGLVGNIYKGRVSRVLPGMQAAFMDIGLRRTATVRYRAPACIHFEGVYDERRYPVREDCPRRDPLG